MLIASITTFVAISLLRPFAIVAAMNAVTVVPDEAFDVDDLYVETTISALTYLN